jgi:thiol-disulfide isomerase/thioredoxin
MRQKLVPVIGAAAAFAFMVLLFKPHAADSPTLPPDRRHALPAYTASDLHGRRWDLADHRGKVVLLNFWASWCAPCRRETPGLVRLSRDYAGKPLEIVGVAMDDSMAPVRRFVAAAGIPYPTLLPDQDDPLASRVESLPTTLLIDARGRVAKTYYGAESEKVFRRDIERLLAEL